MKCGHCRPKGCVFHYCETCLSKENTLLKANIDRLNIKFNMDYVLGLEKETTRLQGLVDLGAQTIKIMQTAIRANEEEISRLKAELSEYAAFGNQLVDSNKQRATYRAAAEGMAEALELWLTADAPLMRNIELELQAKRQCRSALAAWSKVSGEVAG